MKVRILFRDYEISDVNKQQLLYGVAVLVSILSVFSIIFMLSYYSADPNQAAFPSGTPASTFTNNLSQAAQQNPQVAGAQYQNHQAQQQQPVPLSPQLPTPKPSPSAMPSPSALPSPSPSPSSAPSASPSSAPSQAPQASSAPAPSTPTGLKAVSGCDGTNVKVLLTWNSTSNASGYKIFRDDKEIKDHVEGTNYSDTSVTVGTIYAYSIKAKGNGDSPYSDSQTITPTSCSSPAPTASAN